MKIQVGKTYKHKKGSEVFIEFKSTTPFMRFPIGTFFGVYMHTQGAFDAFNENGEVILCDGRKPGGKLVPNKVKKDYWMVSYIAKGELFWCASVIATEAEAIATSQNVVLRDMQSQVHRITREEEEV